jgi:membrane protease YdiL (CAAX protease family)
MKTDQNAISSQTSGALRASCDNVEVQFALLALFLVVAVLLIVRAANRDRRDYRRFKRLKTTRERQLVLGKWLRESFLIFGGLAVAVLLASWNYIGPASASALKWAPLHYVHTHLNGAFGLGLAIGLGSVFVLVMVVPVVLLRRQLTDVPAIGDIGSLLPRTRGELKYGAGLSINAGIIEELLFRLGMPALLFGITGNGVIAFAAASLLFGLLHIYQKIWGVLGATLLGLIFTLLYLLTGSIWVVMLVHALIDLRSLVLIPLLVKKVWRVAGP